VPKVNISSILSQNGDYEAYLKRYLDDSRVSKKTRSGIVAGHSVKDERHSAAQTRKWNGSQPFKNVGLFINER